MPWGGISLTLGLQCSMILFGVENPVKVQRYVDNTVGYPAVGPEMETRRILLSMYQIVEF